MFDYEFVVNWKVYKQWNQSSRINLYLLPHFISQFIENDLANNDINFDFSGSKELVDFTKLDTQYRW